MSEHLLEVEHLKQYFPIKTGFFTTKPLKAVDNVSFTIDHGEQEVILNKLWEELKAGR